MTTESHGDPVDETLVLVKTEKGSEALQIRSRGLPQRWRTVLVLVDGRQAVGALVARFGALSDIQAALQDLLERGLIGRANPGN